MAATSHCQSVLEPIIAKYAASPGPGPGNSWDKYGHAWHELYCFTALQVPSQDGWWYHDYHNMQSTTFIIPNFVCISPQKTFYIFSKVRKMFSIMFNSILFSYYEFWILVKNFGTYIFWCVWGQFVGEWSQEFPRYFLISHLQLLMIA